MLHIRPYYGSVMFNEHCSWMLMVLNVKKVKCWGRETVFLAIVFTYRQHY